MDEKNCCYLELNKYCRLTIRMVSDDQLVET
jgi:hypothetical protein